MANAISGGLCTLKYGYESTYGSTSASINKVFGVGQLPNISIKNNGAKIFGIGQRNAERIPPMKFEGTADFEFVVCSSHFLRLLTTTYTDTSIGGGEYQHDFYEAIREPSFTLEVTNATDSAISRRLQGCKVDELILTATVGEALKAKITAPFKTETTVTGSSSGTESREPLTFAHGSIYLNYGAGLTLQVDVQSIEIGIKQNVELLWGIGSRFATQAVEKQREYSLKFTIALEDRAVILEKIWGGTGGPSNPTSISSCTFSFTNGLTGASRNTLTLYLANGIADEETQSMSPEEIVKEEVTFLFRESGNSAIFARAIDGTATTP